MKGKSGSKGKSARKPMKDNPKDSPAKERMERKKGIKT